MREVKSLIIRMSPEEREKYANEIRKLEKLEKEVIRLRKLVSELEKVKKTP